MEVRPRLALRFGDYWAVTVTVEKGDPLTNRATLDPNEVDVLIRSLTACRDAANARNFARGERIQQSVDAFRPQLALPAAPTVAQELEARIERRDAEILAESKLTDDEWLAQVAAERHGA